MAKLQLTHIEVRTMIRSPRIQWRPQRRRLLVEALEDRCLLSATSPAAQASAEGGLEYLRGAMDQYHDRFWVYDDNSSAGDHFHVRAKTADDLNAVSICGAWTEDVYSRATSTRCEFLNTTGVNYGGYYFMNGVLLPGELAPRPNWGFYPNAGVDLSGATALVFKAKGASGGEKIEFFVGGVGRDSATGIPNSPYPGSSPRYPPQGTVYDLAKDKWKTIRIDVSGLDMSYVLGGFGWVANAPNNRDGAVFYLDEMYFELTPSATATAQ